MTAVVDFPEGERAVIQTGTAFWPRSFSRSSRVTEPSCQVMLVDFSSDIFFVAWTRRASPAATRGEDCLRSVGELEAVAFGIFSVAEFERVGRCGVLAHAHAFVDELLTRFG